MISLLHLTCTGFLLNFLVCGKASVASLALLVKHKSLENIGFLSIESDSGGAGREIKLAVVG